MWLRETLGVLKAKGDALFSFDINKETDERVTLPENGLAVPQLAVNASTVIRESGFEILNSPLVRLEANLPFQVDTLKPTVYPHG